MGRCGCGSGSCSCQFVSSGSIEVSGTGAAGAPFQARVTRRTIMLGWGGKAADLELLESHRVPVPAGTIVSAELTVTDPAGGSVATEFDLMLNGTTPLGTTQSIAAGASSLTYSPGLALPSGGLLSIKLNGTRGNHTTGLVTITYSIA